MILDGDDVVYEVVQEGVVLGVENAITEDLDDEEAKNFDGLLKVLSWYEILDLTETSVENSFFIGVSVVVENLEVGNEVDLEFGNAEDLEVGDVEALKSPGLFLMLLIEAL